MMIGFFLIMFAFIELPLIGFFVAPELATAETIAFNSWLDRNANRLATRCARRARRAPDRARRRRAVLSAAVVSAARGRRHVIVEAR